MRVSFIRISTSKQPPNVQRKDLPDAGYEKGFEE